MRLIVQLSEQRTGSTLLTNILYGLISPEIPVLFLEHVDKWAIVDNLSENIIVKTHDGNIKQWVGSFPNLEVYFVCSWRNDDQVKCSVYPEMDNLTTVSYEELLETEENTLDNIVSTVYNRVAKMIPNLEMSESSAKKRIVKMNRKVEELRNKPFSYVDPFYQVHGSHRNRG